MVQEGSSSSVSLGELAKAKEELKKLQIKDPAPHLVFPEDRREIVAPKPYLVVSLIFCIFVLWTYHVTLETERGSVGQWKRDLGVLVEKWRNETAEPVEDFSSSLLLEVTKGKIMTSIHVPQTLDSSKSRGGARGDAKDALARVRQVAETTFSFSRDVACKSRKALTDSCVGTPPCPMSFSTSYFTTFHSVESDKLAEDRRLLFGAARQEGGVEEQLRDLARQAGDRFSHKGILAAGTSGSTVSPLKVIVSVIQNEGEMQGKSGETVSRCSTGAKLIGSSKSLPGSGSGGVEDGQLLLVCVTTLREFKPVVASGLVSLLGLAADGKKKEESSSPCGIGRHRPQSSTVVSPLVRGLKSTALINLQSFLRLTSNHEIVPVPLSLEQQIYKILCYEAYVATLGESSKDGDDDQQIVPPHPFQHHCKSAGGGENLFGLASAASMSGIEGRLEEQSDILLYLIPKSVINALEFVAGIQDLPLNHQLTTSSWATTIRSGSLAASSRKGGKLGRESLRQRLYEEIVEISLSLSTSPLLLPQAQMPMEQALAIVAPLFVPIMLGVLIDLLKQLKRKSKIKKLEKKIRKLEEEEEEK